MVPDNNDSSRPRKRSVTGTRRPISGDARRRSRTRDKQNNGDDLDNLYEEFRRNKSVDL